MVQHYAITLGPFARGFHIITGEIKEAVGTWPDNGMLHAFIRHTSAALTINENADDTVREDFKLFFEMLAPEQLPGIKHDMEGPDDMPAHIKSTLARSEEHTSEPPVTPYTTLFRSKEAVGTWPDNGMLHAFIRHTSAALTINENADDTVREDFKLFFEMLAPEQLPGIKHDMEGPDDMPAHIKSTLA